MVLSAHLPKVNPDILVNLTDDYSSEFIVDPAEVENRLAKINIRHQDRITYLVGFYGILLRI